MTKPITIPQSLPQGTALSYDFLREEGLKAIQQMAGTTWTDHNVHDPGITMLEELCYAMTELAYRINYDMKDLLSKEGASAYGSCYSPATILTTNPVTMLDLRKIVIDVAGVKNAWVEKVPQGKEGKLKTDELGLPTTPKGLYKVLIERDSWSEASGTEILAKAKARLQACRGVCEDFEAVNILSNQDIWLQGTVEVGRNIEDINQLVANVLYRVSTHLSPRITFHTLPQMIEKGKRADEIFDGPPLEHGFIDDYELGQHPRKTEVHASDIIREIMDEQGVLAIDAFVVGTGLNTTKDWILPLDGAKTPKLDVDKTLQSLEFTSQGLQAGIDIGRVKSIYKQLGAQGISAQLPEEARDIIIPEKKPRDLAQYYSLQNQFPENYGIGEAGLPNSAPVKRKAQAQQLKAYLVFFEQLLANSFAQLDHFKDLAGFEADDYRSVFNQSLLGSVEGLSEVLESEESYESYLQEMAADNLEGLKRKNKWLTHLLARFGEAFNGYGMLLQANAEGPLEVEKQLIADKGRFLREYPEISGGRARAYDYTKDFWENDNIAGLEKRIARKLGIQDYSRRGLGAGETEGLHMIEHVLLRPYDKDLMPINAHYTLGQVTTFKAGTTAALVRCTAVGHTLHVGEHIRITAASFNEEYRVVSVGQNFFEIEESLANMPAEASWQRQQPDLRHWVLTAPVEEFAQGTDATRTFCKAQGHGLRPGSQVAMFGTGHYDGLQDIVAITDEGFEIAADFAGAAPLGRWMRAGRNADPYSLQVTFVLPKWIARYQENPPMRKFVENVIREETPAHLSVYIQWLEQPEMQQFDQAYQRFLGTIKQRA